MSTDDDDPTYEVGYGKPPRHSQFRRGQSGNLRGRPPRSRNVETILKNTLFRPVSVKENGKSRKVPVLEAFLMLMAKTSLSGDPGAANRMIRLLPLILQTLEAEAMRAQAGEASADEPQVAEVDRDVLRHFADMVREGGFTFEEESEE